MDAYEKFRESGQPSVKLEIALEEYFLKDNESQTILSQEQRQEYEEYLKKRRYPALEMLAKKGNTHILKQFLEKGWVTREQRLRVLFSGQITDTSVRAILLQREIKSRNRVQQSQGLKPLLEFWGRKISMEFAPLCLVLTEMRYEEGSLEKPFGMDGKTIYYDEKCWKQRPDIQEGWHSYLHMLCHGIFRHFKMSGEINQDLWSTACDVAAEYWLEQIFPNQSGHIPKEPRRFIRFQKEDICQNPGSVLKYLKEHPQEVENIRSTFCKDAHSVWYQGRDTGQKYAMDFGTEGTGEGKGVRKGQNIQDSNWKRVYEEILKNHKVKKSHYGLSPGSRREKAVLREENQFDFENYLRRFTVAGEEMQLDMDSFDYIPYDYGIRRYGNMPLLEPLEYTEVSKVEELVIAIDTSGSCSREIVGRFLEATKNILTNRENFFRHMQVHILQCDSMVHMDTKIESVKEWENYIAHLMIEGRGGTDFTPVFTHVEGLRRDGTLKNLKGLLYFTDGDGIYPTCETEYETAFVFLDHRFLDYPVPKWIVRLCLEDKNIL